ncbi:MAG TPA: hypothetical protein PKO36_18380 [Candidatus Hydrogenedentes bacterium]|nr:hypothetical protein [Candidatus Hydrogenedentota bacterium]HOT52037.1 hypothetical protein [Candidatus Hydrogenedentota bacterium]HOV73332.1 hypothetical protein [Candidatus Hydrogenedentota bacterium]HPC15435.1 hypothetical protein [Candidatus Hydrogenedentota bacterium]HRT21126.1 hypothetical protein [Candidatus Hydrogenedentota bacterium]
MKVLKLLAVLLIATIAFAGSLAGLLAYSGNLSKEGFEKILRPKSPPKTAAETPRENGDQTSALALALKQREEELDRREARIREEEARLQKARADLDALRTEIQAVQTQIAASIKTVDADQKKRMEDVALSLGQMKAEKAAETMKNWPMEDAIAILRFVKEKERAKILDAMPPEQAGAILLGLQNKKL